MTKKVLFISLSLSLIAILTYLTGINNPFLTTGEPREALVAQSMLINNDFLESVRYDADLATKPPFFHWCILFLSKITGNVTEMTARMPSLIFAVLAICSWFVFLYKNLGKKVAFMSFFILLTAPEWYRHACLARIDMTLTGFTTLSFIALYPWLNGKSKFPFLSLIPLTLGTLTKGPIAIVLPLGSAFLTVLYKTIFMKKIDINGCFKYCLQMFFMGIISLIGYFAWFAIQIGEENRNIIDIAINENIARFLDTMDKGEDPHSKSIFYLLGALIAGITPWGIFILFGIRDFIKNMKTYIKPNQTFFVVWCAISSIFCIVFFMIPEGKRGVYLLPCYPFLATLLALICNKIEENKPLLVKKITYTLSIIFSILLIFVIILKYNLVDISLFQNYKTLDKLLFYIDLIKDKMTFLKGITAILPFILTIIILKTYKNKQNYFIRFALIFIIFFIQAKIFIINPVSHKLSAKHFVAQSLQDIKTNKVVMLTTRMYPVIFYIRNFNKNINVFDYNDNNKSSYVFLWKSDEHLLNNFNNYVLTTSPNDIQKYGKFLEFAKEK